MSKKMHAELKKIANSLKGSYLDNDYAQGIDEQNAAAEAGLVDKTQQQMMNLLSRKVDQHDFN